LLELFRQSLGIVHSDFGNRGTIEGLSNPHRRSPRKLQFRLLE
jgi:hypothetical protein